METSIVTIAIGGREVTMRVNRWADGDGAMTVAIDPDLAASNGKSRIVGYSLDGQVLRREHALDFRAQKDARLRKQFAVSGAD